MSFADHFPATTRFDRAGGGAGVRDDLLRIVPYDDGGSRVFVRTHAQDPCGHFRSGEVGD